MASDSEQKKTFCLGADYFPVRVIQPPSRLWQVTHRHTHTNIKNLESPLFVTAFLRHFLSCSHKTHSRCIRRKCSSRLQVLPDVQTHLFHASNGRLQKVSCQNEKLCDVFFQSVQVNVEICSSGTREMPQWKRKLV